jgi:hypothetical protein
MAITRSFAVGMPASGGAASGSGTTLTTATFDSTGFTHLVVFTKHEGATTTITPSDNKGSTGWTSLTKQANSVNDSWGQLHWVKIGTPGTLHTVTMTLGAARDFRQMIVWRVNSGTGEMALAHATPANAQATAAGGTAAVDAGTLTTDAASVSFMGVAEYAAAVYTVGTGWTEDFDPNGPNYTYGQSRSDASGATIDPACTGSGAQEWAACAASFKEASAGATSYTLTAGQGSYTLTGQAANLLRGAVLTAAQGSYGLTGQDATLTYSSGPKVLTAGQGSYAITGQDAGLFRGWTLTAEQGSYTLTGSDALVDLSLSAASGTYTLTGQDANLSYNSVTARTILADQGAYALTGQDVSFTRPARVLVAEQGAYVINGGEVTLAWSGAPPNGIRPTQRRRR